MKRLDCFSWADPYHIIVFVLLILMILPGYIVAAEAEERKERANSRDFDPTITLGLGAGFAPEYEGANEYRPIPFIIARARVGARYFFGTDGNGLRADVVGSRFIEAGPALGFRFRRGSNADDPVIALLPEVEQAVEVGGFANFNFPFPFFENEKDALTIGASFLQDVVGAHEGFTINTSLRYRGLVTERLILQVGPFATYASEAFVDAYYGVSPPASTLSGLPVFDPDAGWKDVGFAFNSRYKFTDNWNINITLSGRRFLGDAEESPIIEQQGARTTAFGGAALAYSF